MIIDRLNTFSSAQALTGTAASTDIIDTRGAGDIGIAECPMFILVGVDTTFTSSGSTTMTIKIQTDDNASFSSATDLYTSASIAKATMVAGTRLLHIPLPIGCERYIRLYYTVSTADFTAGKIDAYLLPSIGSETKVYATTVPTP